MKKMNKAQAQALFEENAILFGDRDAVPKATVTALLGQAAVNYVLWADTAGSGRKGYYNGIGMNEHIKPLIEYITLAGFMQAVTYNNAILTAQEG